MEIEEDPHKDYLVEIDGNRTYFRIYGDRSLLNPVIYFHGLPGCRIEASLIHSEAEKLKFSIISIDRPGCGKSDYPKNSNLQYFLKAIEKILATLSVEKFKILGVSGGTPYALACADYFKTRVTAGVIVSGAFNFNQYSDTEGMLWSNRLILEIVRRSKTLGRLCIKILALGVHYFPDLILSSLKLCSAKDQEILKDELIASTFKENFSQAVSRGSEGVFNNIKQLFSNSDTISSIPFQIYHGDMDKIVPCSSAERINKVVTNSHITVIKEEGHLLAIKYAQQILERLSTLP